MEVDKRSKPRKTQLKGTESSKRTGKARKYHIGHHISVLPALVSGSRWAKGNG